VKVTNFGNMVGVFDIKFKEFFREYKSVFSLFVTAVIGWTPFGRSRNWPENTASLQEYILYF
jgi:hypothetical protein